MKIEDALAGVTRIYLDTAPVIYLVERNDVQLRRVTEMKIIVVSELEI